MDVNLYRGARLSRKNAKKTYCLAHWVAWLCFVAKFLLMVFGFLTFWYIIWRLPGATLDLIAQYRNHCSINSIEIAASQMDKIEKISKIMQELSAWEGVYFTGVISRIGILSSSAKFAKYVYIAELISVVILAIAVIRFVFFRGARNIWDARKLPPHIYGSKYYEAYNNLNEIIRAINNMRLKEYYRASCHRLAKKTLPKNAYRQYKDTLNKAINENFDARAQQEFGNIYFKVTLKQLKFQKRNQKKKLRQERRLAEKNPRNSDTLTEILYFKCHQMFQCVWGQDAEEHVDFDVGKKYDNEQKFVDFTIETVVPEIIKDIMRTQHESYNIQWEHYVQKLHNKWKYFDAEGKYIDEYVKKRFGYKVRAKRIKLYRKKLEAERKLLQSSYDAYFAFKNETEDLKKATSKFKRQLRKKEKAFNRESKKVKKFEKKLKVMERKLDEKIEKAKRKHKRIDKKINKKTLNAALKNKAKRKRFERLSTKLAKSYRRTSKRRNREKNREKRKNNTYKTKFYSIFKSFTNYLRWHIMFTFILIAAFLLITGILAGLSKFGGFDFNLYKWFYDDAKGKLLFLVIGGGIFFYFLCGTLAGNILEIERDDKDDYYSNLEIVGNKDDKKHIYFREIGRIKKNTAKRHAGLKRVARENGVTLFVFRNLFQMIFVFGSFILLLLILKTEAFNIVSLVKYAKAKDMPLMGKLISCGVWLLLLLATFCISCALWYTFSRNEFKTITMREDCRKKAMVRYRLTMGAAAFCILGWLILLLVFGNYLSANRIMWIKIIGLFLVSLMGMATDIVFNPREPDQDIGVDFFSDDGGKRDPDDGPYIAR